MTKYDHISSFQAVAEFFPQGSIIPQRILNGPRSLKHRFKFGSNTWAIPTPKGYVCAVDCGDALPWLKITAPRQENTYCAKPVKPRPMGSINFSWSPYTKGGNTHWTGNTGLTDEQWVENLNRALHAANSSRPSSN